MKINCFSKRFKGWVFVVEVLLCGIGVLGSGRSKTDLESKIQAVPGQPL